MRNVTIAVIQLQNELSKKTENLEKAEELICKAAQQGAKLVCLPELFVTGYNLDVFGETLYDMAEGLSGPQDGQTWLLAPMGARGRPEPRVTL